MKALKYLFAGVCSVLMFTSCLDDFKELNTDMEQLGSTDPRNVFTGATMNFNNSSRSHLTGLYSGNMVYMQYLVPTGGASSGTYINPARPNEHPSPYAPAYSDYYGSHGLRLNYLITNVIPNNADAERYNDLKAISQILLNYEQWKVLDTYGAAPITEAFRAQTDGIRTPRYDLYQADIDGNPMYKRIDSEVKAAIDELKKSNDTQYNLGNNDFFYNGDVAKWIKFGNTFRVKMAMRLEKADNAFYNQVIGEVCSSASNLIASNDESCVYNHPNDYNDNTDDIQDIIIQYAASEAFVNYMVANNDPRLPILVRPNGFGEGNNNTTADGIYDDFVREYPNWTTEAQYAKFAANRYTGMSANPENANDEFEKNAYLTRPYHKEDGSVSTLEIRMYSQPEGRYYVKNGGIIGNNNMPARIIEDNDYYVNQQKMHNYTPVITYAETCFMMAEIAVKKSAAIAGKDATAWYREGIKASMQQYIKNATDMWVVAQTQETAATYNPLDEAKINAFLAQPQFQTATLEKIISQEWIHMYNQPDEMWAVWKRTGLPAFKATPDCTNDGVAYFEEIKESGSTMFIPRRNALGTPNSLNLENYLQAVESMKKDAKYGADVSNTEGRIWWDVE